MKSLFFRKIIFVFLCSFIVIGCCKEDILPHEDKSGDHVWPALEQARKNRELIDQIQHATFDYFWEFAHPVSGLMPRRSINSQQIGIGASGFGVSCIIVGVHRNWISRKDALDRLLKITDFLLNKADHFHGVFPHLLDGTTGKLIKFGGVQDGGDLQETSNLISGLLIAREYFNESAAKETQLRKRITDIYKRVDYSWHTDNNSGILYWNWSPIRGFTLPLRGFTEGLVSYTLALGSPTHAISTQTYRCWTNGRNFVNGNDYYGYVLSLGKPYGGPLYLAQTSFIGLDPKQMEDQYANYWRRNVNHVMINRAYCVYNAPESHKYSKNNWGLSASQTPDGYNNDASPTDDSGVICPSGALGVFPYTPYYSMQALRYFYEEHKEGLMTKYGFKDAFSIKDKWYSDRHLTLDQGRTVVMMENYRSGLLWKLYMQIDEIKDALKKMGVHKPNYKTGYPYAIKDQESGYYDLMMHPDREKYLLDFALERSEKVSFDLLDIGGNKVLELQKERILGQGVHVLEIEGEMPVQRGFIRMNLADNPKLLKVHLH